MVETQDVPGQYEFSSATETEYVRFRKRLPSGDQNTLTRAANNIRSNPRGLPMLTPPHRDCIKWQYPEDFGLSTNTDIYEFRPTCARGIYEINDGNRIIQFLVIKRKRFFTMSEWP